MDQIYTTISSGAKMPLLGLGVYNMHGRDAERAVKHAIDLGYRLIDTATSYNNEKEVGNAIRASGLARKDLFVTTKVPNTEQGYDKTLKAFDKSERELDIEYIDLYLVHWPIKATRKDTWKALERLYQEKRVRAVGVANYLIPFLEELKTYAQMVPMVNQVEFSPFLFLRDLLAYCKEAGIQLQAYTPLVRGSKMENPLLMELSAKYQKTPAQVILRWNIQHGVSVIPKSANPDRQRENLDIFDFSISPEDMNRIDGLNENYRVVEDPMGML